MRGKLLVVGFGIAAAAFAPLISAQSAGADALGNISVSCSAVTFTYTGFPTGVNVIDAEQVAVDGNVVVNKAGLTTFSFTGSSATDTVPISSFVSDGASHVVAATASWSTAGGGEASAFVNPFGPCGTGCPSMTKANFRWHYAANGSSGSWSGTKSAVCPASLTMGPQSMEGDLKVAPGTVLETGYDFTVPGNNTAMSITVTNPQVVFSVDCVSGGTPSAATFTVAMPTQTYSVTGSAWYPSGDQHSPLVYQGTLAVPDLCGGGALRLNHGGTFSAVVS